MPSSNDLRQSTVREAKLEPQDPVLKDHVLPVNVGSPETARKGLMTEPLFNTLYSGCPIILLKDITQLRNGVCPVYKCSGNKDQNLSDMSQETVLRKVVEVVFVKKDPGSPKNISFEAQ